MAGVRRVKSTDGPDLVVWGSSTLTSVLLEQGLVDEVVLAVYPVLLGRGKRCFSDSADPRELALVSTKTTPTGLLLNTYRYVGSLRTESPADDLINPPDQEILQRQNKRVQHGSAIVIPESDQTVGHGSQTKAVLWKKDLVRFPKNAEPR
jgi:hypothetical protein